MKLEICALFLLVAGIYAFPSVEDKVNELDQPIQRNAAEDRVREGFRKFIERVKSEGYDPLEVERREIGLDIPIIGIRFSAFIENVIISDLSDIRISSLEYSYIFNRLRIDVYIPEIKVLFDNSKFGLIRILNQDYEGVINGNMSINEFRIQGLVYVNVNLIGQVSLRSIELDSSIKGIESNVEVLANGNDSSEYVNNLFSVRLPAYFENNKAEFDAIFELIVEHILWLIWI